MNIKTVAISSIKENDDNPRYITDKKLSKLVKSIKDFPKMLDIRPIVVDANMIVLGGNMRLRACKEAGLKEVPIIIADDLDDEQKKEFIIKDNVGFGEWDWTVLSDKWDADLLDTWGLEIEMPKVNDENPAFLGEYDLASELTNKQNYIVLTFDNETDWKNAQTVFNIKTEKTKRKNGKDWSRGVGKVINGADAINRITDV